jgi:hypothetical protein
VPKLLKKPAFPADATVVATETFATQYEDVHVGDKFRGDHEFVTGNPGWFALVDTPSVFVAEHVAVDAGATTSSTRTGATG